MAHYPFAGNCPWWKTWESFSLTAVRILATSPTRRLFSRKSTSVNLSSLTNFSPLAIFAFANRSRRVSITGCGSALHISWPRWKQMSGEHAHPDPNINIPCLYLNNRSCASRGALRLTSARKRPGTLQELGKISLVRCASWASSLSEDRRQRRIKLDSTNFYGVLQFVSSIKSSYLRSWCSEKAKRYRVKGDVLLRTSRSRLRGPI